MQLQHGVFPSIWYVAAYGSAVTRQPLARRICDKPVVLYRTASGRAVALEDRCSHRAMRLSQGECEGEIIRCSYHGFEFDPTGACARIPGQEKAPSAAGIKSYRLVEKDNLLWIWMGSPETADISKVPDNPIHTDPAWEMGTHFHMVQADWQLISDNLLDLSHVGIVHRKTIGGDDEAHYAADVKVTTGDNSVSMTLRMPNIEVPPAIQGYRAVGVTFKGRVDRWSDVELIPGMLRIWTGFMDVDTGAYDGRRVGGFQLRHNHALTPSTAGSCYWHCAYTRNFGLGNIELGKKIHEMVVAVQDEDKRVIESQYASLMEEPDRAVFDARSDAAAAQGRRLIQRWMTD